MKLKKAAATGLLLMGLGNVSWAVAPCVDRPTPPPCCADGKCYPNPLTFGVYPTRWRQWPVQYAQSTSTGQLPEGVQPDNREIPQFELPSAEEEDRKAPPPTTPREEPLRAPATNTAPAGENAAGPPGRSQPGTQPPAGEKAEPAGPRSTLPPYEPQAPGPKSLNNLNNQQGKSGEADPPPAPPFGPQRFEEGTPVRQASYAPATSSRRSAVQAVNLTSDDPPPGPPRTLGTSLN